MKYYTSEGYLLINTVSEEGRGDAVIAQEYYKVIMVIEGAFHYDESLHLRAADGDNAAIGLLYEGLSRTRERLCLVVVGNKKLYEQILAIRLNRVREDGQQRE